MKTEQTLAIEKALGYYDPAEMCGIKINKFRARHIAYEVPVDNGTTEQGLIDCVGVAEYFGDNKFIKSCFWYIHKIDGMKDAEQGCVRDYPVGEKPSHCDEKTCQWGRSVFAGTPKILITCYEIKITQADFQSKNGHNFVGNLNYYVVPIALYPEIKNSVPEEIGIIVFYDGTQTKQKNTYYKPMPYVGLRRKKECAFKYLDDEAQKWLVLSVLKSKRKERYRQIDEGRPE